MTAKLFCATCNKPTEHEASVTPAREIDFKCGCGHFVRAQGTAEEVKKFIAAHNTYNVERKPAPGAESSPQAVLKSLKAAGVIA